MSAPDKLLTVREVGAWLQVSTAFVRDHSGEKPRRRPVIPCIMIGETRRFRRQDVDSFIEACSKCRGMVA